MILQPVLQWGPSAAGGGQYWAVASWYADGSGGTAHYSTLVQVNAGQVLVGVMTQTGSSPTGFSYNCQFQGVANTSLSVQNVQQLTWFAETLEAYSLTKASDYPATTMTAFTGIELKTGTTDPALAWTSVDSVTDTGQHAIVVSDANPGGEVDIYYNEYKEWVYALYADLLGRAPDAGGLANWTTALINGQSLQSVVTGFLESAEYCTDTITGIYQQLLSRAPDSGGLANWVATMERGTPLQQIILGFCNSSEYQHDNPLPTAFVTSLYERLLGRAPDPAGEQNWINNQPLREPAGTGT
jgi:uncharacterized protein DUF4214